jgi:hypothetical protein
MTLQANAAEDLAPAAPRNEKATEVLFHPVVREVYLRKNLKYVVQTRGGGLLDGDDLRSHVIV